MLQYIQYIIKHDFYLQCCNDYRKLVELSRFFWAYLESRMDFCGPFIMVLFLHHCLFSSVQDRRTDDLSDYRFIDC